LHSYKVLFKEGCTATVIHKPLVATYTYGKYSPNYSAVTQRIHMWLPVSGRRSPSGRPSDGAIQ